VLLIGAGLAETHHVDALRRMGFSISETLEWPDSELINTHECVVVFIRRVENASMLAARLRAKPRFGRRVLLGVLPATAGGGTTRSLTDSGFDEVLPGNCQPRLLVARLLRRLRERPEYRCLLPRDRRPAA